MFAGFLSEFSKEARTPWVPRKVGVYGRPLFNFPITLTPQLSGWMKLTNTLRVWV